MPTFDIKSLNREERQMKKKTRKSWRCFHCDEVFTNPIHAAEHFGEGMHDKPACKLGATKGHLITLIRKLQRELASYRHEDSEFFVKWGWSLYKRKNYCPACTRKIMKRLRAPR